MEWSGVGAWTELSALQELSERDISIEQKQINLSFILFRFSFSLIFDKQQKNKSKKNERGRKGE